MNESFLRLCGIARKAGKVISGSALVTSAIRSPKKPDLVILTEDTSGNTKKRIRDGCLHHKVELIEVGTASETLGHAVGAANCISCIAISDTGFAKAIKSKINNSDADGKSAGGAIDGNKD